MEKSSSLIKEQTFLKEPIQSNIFDQILPSQVVLVEKLASLEKNRSVQSTEINVLKKYLCGVKF